MDELGDCRSFYIEFAVDKQHGSLVDSMFALRDVGVITGPGQHLFASPHSTLLFVFPDGHEPFSRFIAATKEARSQKRALHGWAFGIRFCGHSSALERLLATLQFKSDATALLYAAIRSTPSIDHLNSALRELLRSILPSLSQEDSIGSKPCSARTRRRQSRREFGLSPKALSSLIRFQKLVPCVADPESTLVDLAASHAFSDQAHFTRDFVRRAGISPGRFRQRWSGRRDVRFIQDQPQGGLVRFGLAIY